MRRGFVAIAALALLVASVGMASAQGGGRRGGMFGGGGIQLLRISEVQQELKMTQPQIDKVDAKQQELQQSMREMFQNAGGFQQLSPEDRQKLMAKVQEMQSKAVADILDTKQQARFKQLELQRQGPTALARKEIADELKLSEE